MWPRSAATYDRMIVPRFITLPIDCSPSENETPSSAVGCALKVLSTELACIPFSKGVYFFGSKVSVCAIPPAIHSRITVSAFDFIFGFAQELTRLAGIPAASAASVAALVFCKNSLRFQFLFISKTIYKFPIVLRSKYQLKLGKKHH